MLQELVRTTAAPVISAYILDSDVADVEAEDTLDELVTALGVL